MKGKSQSLSCWTSLLVALLHKLIPRESPSLELTLSVLAKMHLCSAMTVSGYALRSLTKCGLPEPKVSAVCLSGALLKLVPLFTGEVTMYLLLLLAMSLQVCALNSTLASRSR